MPMQYEVRVARAAQNDIDNIVDYIARELENPIAAVNMADSIVDEIQSLSHMPKRYRVYPREPWKSMKTRFLPIKNFIIMFRVDDTSKIVGILRVFYGRQDI